MACGDDRVFVCAGGGIPQNTIVIGPLDPWPAWSPTIQPHTHYHFASAGLSEADVERIAKRVAEMLREAKP